MHYVWYAYSCDGTLTEVPDSLPECSNPSGVEFTSHYTLSNTVEIPTVFDMTALLSFQSELAGLGFASMLALWASGLAVAWISGIIRRLRA